jgi:hypothetical protein
MRDSALASLCCPPGDEPVAESLMRPQLGLNRVDWPDGRRGWARRWPAEDLWIARRPPA